MYELRLYDVAAGRLAEEVDRMHEVAIAPDPAPPPGAPAGQSMFDRYGIPRPVAAWTALAGPRGPLFAYLLHWDRLADRDAAFPPFWADPVWREIRARTDGGVPMVDRIEDWLLAPTPGWTNDAGAIPEGAAGVHELIFWTVPNGKMPLATPALRDHVLAELTGQGAVVLGAFDLIIGPGIPRVITLLGWPDVDAQRNGWARLEADPARIARLRAEVAAHGAPLLDPVEQHLLHPVDWARPAHALGGRDA